MSVPSWCGRSGPDGRPQAIRTREDGNPMRVRMRVTLAGPDGPYRTGDIVELPADVVARLVAGGWAVPADDGGDGDAPRRSTRRRGGRDIDTASVEPAEEQ